MPIDPASFWKSLRRKLTDHWGVTVLVLFVLGLHWDMVLGASPATGDHMIHLFRGWLMAEHLIPSGRVTGWSHLAFAGYPAGVYYPILGDLLVTLTRWLTLGLLSWERAYTLVIFIVVLAMPLAVYCLARRVAGQPGSLVAAILSVGDVGRWPQGGHLSTLIRGVWPFMLGLSLAVFALLMLEPVLRQPLRAAPKRFIAGVVLIALSVLGHPMSVFFLAVGGLVFTVIFAIDQRRRLGLGPIVQRTALLASAALVLVAFWVVPWLTSESKWTFGWPAVGFGGHWFSLVDLVKSAFRNELFANFSWVAWILGTIGFVLSFVERRPWPLSLSVVVIACLLLVSASYGVGDSVLLRKVQIVRFAAFMKFCWFALAGLAVHSLGQWAMVGISAMAKKRRWPLPEPLPRLVGPVAAVLCGALLVATHWADSYRKVAQIGRLGGTLWAQIVESEQWLAEQPRGPLDRVLYQPGPLCRDEITRTTAPCEETYHRHIFASGPLRTGLPKVKFGYEATAIFSHLPMTQLWPGDTELRTAYLASKEVFDNLSIRWIVSIVPWPEVDWMTEVKQFGSVTIYEVGRGPRQPVTLRGTGGVEVLAFEDERIAVRVSGASGEVQLRLPVAHYYPWQAYHNGRPVPIDTHGVIEDRRRILMSVRVGNGLTELRYERPWYERAAGWVSLVGWIGVLLGLGLLLGRRRTHA